MISFGSLATLCNGHCLIRIKLTHPTVLKNKLETCLDYCRYAPRHEIIRLLKGTLPHVSGCSATFPLSPKDAQTNAEICIPFKMALCKMLYTQCGKKAGAHKFLVWEVIKINAEGENKCVLRRHILTQQFINWAYRTDPTDPMTGCQ